MFERMIDEQLQGPRLQRRHSGNQGIQPDEKQQPWPLSKSVAEDGVITREPYGESLMSWVETYRP